MAVKLSQHQSAADGSTILGMTISAMEDITAEALFKRVVEIAAEKYVSENYAEIVKHLDQRAIATVALARAGQQVAESALTKNISEATEKLVQITKDALERQRRI